MRILVVHTISLILGAALCVEAQTGLRGVDRTAAVNNEEERPVVHDISSSTSGRFLNLMNGGEAPEDEDDTRYVVKVSHSIVILDICIISLWRPSFKIVITRSRSVRI
jgi:hypothetical protein